VIVTAGGTQEPIDPVRFLANRSSGLQGVAIAKSAAARGARVTLIGANIAEVAGVDFVAVSTALELQNALDEFLADSDYLIMTAAVSDFRVKDVSDVKVKRSVVGQTPTLELVANPDILQLAVSKIKALGLATKTVGFAAETASDFSQLRQLAAHKLMAKGCDLLVANDVSEGRVFGSPDNSVLILTKTGVERTVEGTKTEVASAVLDILGEI
jgi:phosphopantothenoylcysteine decarboxylase/phosphopantothenate--cysteine ligase